MRSMTETIQESAKKPRACVPCHQRKVKCNASQVGLPCTRCRRSDRKVDCELVRFSVPLRRPRKRKLGESRYPQEHVWSIQGPSSSLASPEPLRSGGSIPVRPSTHELRYCNCLRLWNPLADLSINLKELPDCGILTSRPEYTGSTDGCSAVDTILLESNGDTILEEDAPLETCRKIAHSSSDAFSPSLVAQPTEGREILEYHDGVSSTTILGELFGHRTSGRFVRLLLREPSQTTYGHPSDIGQETADFLHKRGAFTLPQPLTCQKLLWLYFERVYPYTPVLDRVAFVHQYKSGNYSTFVFQCILTSVAPYMSSQMLMESGYVDRYTAQRSFFAKAQLLYDLGAEKSQLALLQGSLILTSSYFSFGLDKDCRYWLSNAVRLATQLGLHRKHIAEQLELPTQKLFARIFWVMFNKDVLMAISGRVNVRRLNDLHCDVPDMDTEDEEESNPIDNRFSSILPPKTCLQHLYLIHNTRLSQICAKFISEFRIPNPTAHMSTFGELECALIDWRRTLPHELRPETVSTWSQDNIWVLVLRAMSYRFESVLWREARKLPNTQEGDTLLCKQKDAMLELDTILDRIMLHSLVHLCPFSLTTCAATIVAMHIELALSPNFAGSKQSASRTSIQNGITFLRAASEHWHSTKWIIRMFDVIVARAGLALGEPKELTAGAYLQNGFNLNAIQAQGETVDSDQTTSDRTASTTQQFQQPVADAGYGARNTFSSDTYLDEDLLYGPLMMGEEPEKWLDELLTEEVFMMSRI